MELEDESVYREREGKELEALIHPDVKKDMGASVTGQYELVGKSYSVPIILDLLFCEWRRASAKSACCSSVSFHPG